MKNEKYFISKQLLNNKNKNKRRSVDIYDKNENNFNNVIFNNNNILLQSQKNFIKNDINNIKNKLVQIKEQLNNLKENLQNLEKIKNDEELILENNLSNKETLELIYKNKLNEVHINKNNINFKLKDEIEIFIENITDLKKEKIFNQIYNLNNVIFPEITYENFKKIYFNDLNDIFNKTNENIKFFYKDHKNFDEDNKTISNKIIENLFFPISNSLIQNNEIWRVHYTNLIILLKYIIKINYIDFLIEKSLFFINKEYKYKKNEIENNLINLESLKISYEIILNNNNENLDEINIIKKSYSLKEKNINFNKQQNNYKKYINDYYDNIYQKALDLIKNEKFQFPENENLKNNIDFNDFIIKYKNKKDNSILNVNNNKINNNKEKNKLDEKEINKNILLTNKWKTLINNKKEEKGDLNNNIKLKEEKENENNNNENKFNAHNNKIDLINNKDDQKENFINNNILDNYKNNLDKNENIKNNIDLNLSNEQKHNLNSNIDEKNNRYKQNNYNNNISQIPVDNLFNKNIKDYFNTKKNKKIINEYGNNNNLNPIQNNLNQIPNNYNFKDNKINIVPLKETNLLSYQNNTNKNINNNENKKIILKKAKKIFNSNFYNNNNSNKKNNNGFKNLSLSPNVSQNKYKLINNDNINISKSPKNYENLITETVNSSEYINSDNLNLLNNSRNIYNTESFKSSMSNNFNIFANKFNYFLENETFCYYKILNYLNFDNLYNPLNNFSENPEKNGFLPGLISIDFTKNILKIIEKEHDLEKYNLNNNYNKIILSLKNINKILLSNQMKNIIKIYNNYLKYNNNSLDKNNNYYLNKFHRNVLSSRNNKSNININNKTSNSSKILNYGKNKKISFSINKFIHLKNINDINFENSEKIKSVLNHNFSFVINNNNWNFEKIEIIFLNYNDFKNWYNGLYSIYLENIKKENNNEEILFKRIIAKKSNNNLKKNLLNYTCINKKNSIFILKNNKSKNKMFIKHKN